MNTWHIVADNHSRIVSIETHWKQQYYWYALTYNKTLAFAMTVGESNLGDQDLLYNI